MSNKLNKLSGKRDTFTGIFLHYGDKPGWRGAVVPTVLLTDIRDSRGVIVANKQVFNATDAFLRLRLEKGDVVEFSARVRRSPQQRGHGDWLRQQEAQPKHRPCVLAYPTKIRKLPPSTP